MHLTCNVQEADDLYQDTFLKAMEVNDELDFEDNPKSYLLSITLRIWRNRKRKFAWRRRIAKVKTMRIRPIRSWQSREQTERRCRRFHRMTMEENNFLYLR